MTPGASAGKAPSPFRGKDAGEKKQIHARLLSFCEGRPGISGRLAAATNGVLETTQIYDMRQSGRFTMAQWRAVNAAMDWIEKQENKQEGRDAQKEVPSGR